MVRMVQEVGEVVQNVHIFRFASQGRWQSRGQGSVDHVDTGNKHQPSQPEQDEGQKDATQCFAEALEDLTHWAE